MTSIALMLCLLMAASSVYADTSIINVYDANGNLVTGDGRYYEYNDANQLVRVRQGDTIAGPVIAEYFYDFSGQRVKKIENGVVTYYVGKHLEKQVGGANAGSTSYYFGDDGERVAKKDPAGNIFYYHLDHLDGVNAVTDSAGTVVARTDYLPFGDTRSGNSGSEKYSYTGKEKDKTDLYYFEARYNSPEFRHFTQADIAEPDYSDPQDLNRYSYVGNNPLSYVDYDGYKKKKKKHLSKREQRARSLGLNPDKDKYKVGKMSDREYKKALAEHKAASKSVTSVANSSKYSLAGGSVSPNRSATEGESDNYKSSWKGELTGFGQDIGKGFAVEFASDITKQTAKGIYWALKEGYRDIPGIQGAIKGHIMAEMGGRRIMKSTFAPAIAGYLLDMTFDKMEPRSKKVSGKGGLILDLIGAGNLFRYTPLTAESIDENGNVYIDGVFQGNCNCK